MAQSWLSTILPDVEDLVVNSLLTIPGGELMEVFSTSGGPGGQHANRSATRVTLAWDITASGVLDETSRRRLQVGLGERLVGDEIRVTVDDSRSQWRNRQRARRRLVEVLTVALRPPPPKRRTTRPSRRKRQDRLTEKRRRGDTKRMRRPPARDD